MQTSSPAGWKLTITTVVLAVMGQWSVRATGQPTTSPAAISPSTQPYTILQQYPDRLMVQLPNGLIVLAQEIHAAPVVSAQVWVKTGSIYEQQHVGAGLSHFLEHLLAGGGTTTRTEEESNKILGTIGAETNAMTSLENVHYYINTTAPFAMQAVDLLSDWMQHNQISRREYERERSVIQREFEMDEGEPSRVLWTLTQMARYRSHPARHPTIGYLDEFLAISRGEITNFYDRMYVPNNMVFVVCGDIDRQKIVDQVARLWADSDSHKLPELRFPMEPEITEPKAVSGVADIRQPRLRLAWPGTQMGHDRDYALDVLAMVLGQGESSRLVRTVRDEQHLVNTIEAYNLSFHWGKGYFGVDAEIAGGNAPGNAPGAATQPANAAQFAIDKVKAAILEQVAPLRDKEVTPEELARAKRQIMAEVIYSAQTAQGMASRLAGDFIATGDPDYLQRYTKAIDRITAADLRAAAEQYLVPQRLITVTLLPRPAGSKIVPLTRPAEDPQAKSFPTQPVDLDNQVLVTRLQATMAQGPTRAAPAVVDPVRYTTLPNGLRLLIGRTTLVPAVAMQLYSLGGLLSDQPGHEGLASAVALMQVKGTSSRDAQQIARQVEDLGAGLGTVGGNNTAYAQAMCLKQDWPTVLALLADVALHPAFPADEWERMRPRLLAAIDRQQDDWSTELRGHFLKAYFGNHPWAYTPLGQRSVVAGLTAADLQKYFADHLSASQSVLVIFGDVDPDQVEAQVRQLFGSMPRDAAVPFKPLEPQPPKGALTEVATNKGISAVQMGFGPGVARADADFPAMEVASHVLSSFPSGWLDEELRGRGPGLVYAVGSAQVSGVIPGYFIIRFNAEPANLAEALNRTRGQVDRLRNERASDEDLARARAAVLTEEYLGKQSNSDRATEAAIDELYGLGHDQTQKFLRQVQAVDAAKIMEVARKYLKNPVTIVMVHDPVPEASLNPNWTPATQPAP